MTTKTDGQSDENESYTLTPFGLIAMEIGEASARRVTDRLELYLRRHHDTPSAVVLTEDGEMVFAALAVKEQS